MKRIFVQFSAPNRSFATGMAVLRALNGNFDGVIQPDFCLISGDRRENF